MSDTDPLSELKQLLSDMTETQLRQYVNNLGEARRAAPEPVKRSSKTGAPSKNKKDSAMAKLDKLLALMSNEEREIFLKELEPETIGGEE